MSDVHFNPQEDPAAGGGEVLRLDKYRRAAADAAAPAPTAAASEPSREAAPASVGDGRRVPVDPPDLPGTGVVQERRRSIIPEWLHTKADLVAAMRHTGELWWYASRYHAVRVPVYAARLAVMAPRGACRFVVSTNKWVWDMEAAPLRDAAVRAENAAEYLTLSRRRDHRVRMRVLVALVAPVFGVVTALTLYVMGPAWLYLVACVALLTLGFAGQEKDAPVIGPAVVKTEVQKLTGTIVLRALNSIGIPKICAAIKKGGEMDGMWFVSEICRDGPGYRADLDLPLGVIPEDIMEKREELASGLRRKLGCVWPSGDPNEHAGRLVLWVGDRPMNETTKPAWPLAKSGQVDLFKPVVFGNDQRMRWVAVTLMFASVVIGSIPRMGKTFLMRLFLLIAALHPRAVLYGFEFKGTGDFGPLEPVCHRYRCGEESEDIEYVLHSLRELQQELRRRAKVIRSLPRKRCPESKVTPELASDRSLGLYPIVMGMDECQKAFEHEKYGKEIEAICEDIVKRGPALGIIGMFGTQRPDAKSLPPGISNNAVLRFCLKVMGWQANDMVLGDGMHKAGYQATMFSRDDLGICWMAGEGDDPRIVCGAFVDANGADQVVARARQMREEYGNITGHAIGQEPASDEGQASTLLVDIAAVKETGEDKAWSETVVDRLAEYKPDLYGSWAELEGRAKPDQLGSALKPYGISTEQIGRTIDGKRVTRRGIVFEHITTAITERNKKRTAK